MKLNMKMNNRSHRYDINRPRPRHEHKCTQYKTSQYNDCYMYQSTPKHHLKLNPSKS